MTGKSKMFRYDPIKEYVPSERKITEKKKGIKVFACPKCRNVWEHVNSGGAIEDIVYGTDFPKIGLDKRLCPACKLPSSTTIKAPVILRETDDAIQIKWNRQTVWFPKSQITIREDPTSISIPDWLFNKKFG
jgi:hypothetical protein